MDFILYLQTFVLLIFLTCSTILIFSKNPAHSVFFLVVVFFCSSVLLIMFGFDFIGLLFLIIYVGAISVLFLFVVMMLDLQVVNLTQKEFYKIGFTLFIILPVVFYLLHHFNSSFLFTKIFFLDSLFINFDSFSNIKAFSQCLFNYFGICIVIAGIILLVALVGSVVLTFNYNIKKKKTQQLHSRQLSKQSHSSLSFFK